MSYLFIVPPIRDRVAGAAVEALEVIEAQVRCQVLVLSHSSHSHSCAVQPEPSKEYPPRGQVACGVCACWLFQQASTVDLPCIASSHILVTAVYFCRYCMRAFRESGNAQYYMWSLVANAQHVTTPAGARLADLACKQVACDSSTNAVLYQNHSFF